MPRFLPESGMTVPMSGLTIDYSNAVMAMPSGVHFLDLESRIVHNVSGALSSEVMFESISGLLGVSTATGWLTIGFN